jgi:hypothetical protein
MTRGLGIAVVAWLALNSVIALAVIARRLDPTDRLLILALLLVWIAVSARTVQWCGCAP